MSQNIDLIILKYFLSDKKWANVIDKEADVAYFEKKYQEFYTIIHSALKNPEISNILSIPALIEYLAHIHKSHFKDHILNIYEQLDAVQITENDFSFYLSVFKKRYANYIASQLSADIKTSLSAEKDSKQITSLISATNKQMAEIFSEKAIDEGTLGEDIVNIYKEYNYIRAAPEQFRGVMSGCPSIDQITNGFAPGELIFIAGFESSGKSLLSMVWGVNAWLGSNTIDTDPSAFVDDGKNILYFSLEMPRSNKGKMSSGANLNKRLVSCIGHLPFSALRRGELEETDLLNFKKTCKFIKEYDKHKKMYICDMPRGVDVDDIEQKFLEIRQQFNIDLVIIDYIGLMGDTDPDNPDWLQQGRIAAGLHEMARTYSIPIISPCQLNRPNTPNKSMNNQKYNVTRLARSAGISQNANMVFVIESRDNEHMYGDMPIQIVKMRDGQKGEIQLIKDFAYMKIHDPLSSSFALNEVEDMIGVDTSEDNDE